MRDAMQENTSGQGPNAVVPPQLRGWNWGAFLLTWIWGLGNNVLLALLTLVPLVGLVMWIVLGVKGNEWAWQSKRWDSIEHFQRVQRAWAKWGVIVLLACFTLAIGFACVVIFAVESVLEHSTPYETAIARLHATPAAMEALGEPVKTGWPSGSMHTSDGESDATLAISATGSRKSGVVHVEGSGHGEQWRYQRIELVVDGRSIDLRDLQELPPDSR